MKTVKLAFVSAALILAGCSDNSILLDDGRLTGQGTDMIQFSDSYVDNITRASKSPSAGGTGFDAGDVMAIYGYQTIADPSQVVRIFNNTPVTKQTDGTWTYQDPRYWNIGSLYEFYGIYPASIGHTFNPVYNTPYFTIPDFTVQNKKDNQVDVMIAAKNTTSPYNTVNMVFNHLLCNVNFYLKVQDKFVNEGIESFRVLDFSVTDLRGKGTYTQTGFDSNNKAVGAWAVDENSIYLFEEVSPVSISKGQQVSLGDDLLLMPQQLSDGAIVKITYKATYKDGTTSVFGPKTFKLNTAIATARGTGQQKVITEWEPDYRYNYYLAVNPSINTDPTVDFDGGIDDYKNPTADIIVLGDDDPFYFVDVDGDGEYDPTVDYPVLWKDIDGDGLEEGIPDKNRDGRLDSADKFDDDQVDYNGNPDDPILNPDNLDVIMMDCDGDGIAETPLQRGVVEPPVKDATIEFSADVDEWIDEWDAEPGLTGR